MYGDHHWVKDDGQIGHRHLRHTATRWLPPRVDEPTFFTDGEYATLTPQRFAGTSAAPDGLGAPPRWWCRHRFDETSTMVIIISSRHAPIFTTIDVDGMLSAIRQDLGGKLPESAFCCGKTYFFRKLQFVFVSRLSCYDQLFTFIFYYWNVASLRFRIFIYSPSYAHLTDSLFFLQIFVDLRTLYFSHIPP